MRASHSTPCTLLWRHVRIRCARGSPRMVTDRQGGSASYRGGPPMSRGRGTAYAFRQHTRNRAPGCQSMVANPHPNHGMKHEAGYGVTALLSLVRRSTVIHGGEE
jgi:hypothetical protein